MNFANFNTHRDSPDQAFEGLCNQLFERWVRTNRPGQVRYFTTVNGAGGDGGVEAYAELTDGTAVAVQAKWFLEVLHEGQINQIRDSITTALGVRPHLRHYIVCVPRDFLSTKFGRGKKGQGKQLITESEEDRVNTLLAELQSTFPNLTVEFWTEHKLREQVQQPDNEGIARFWFEREELSQLSLKRQFELAKTGWLQERYSPDLHCQGVIQKAVEEALFTLDHRTEVSELLVKHSDEVSETIKLLEEFIECAEAPDDLNKEFQGLKENLELHRGQLEEVNQAICDGNDNSSLVALGEVAILSIRAKINDGTFSNRVRSIRPRLLTALEQLHQFGLSNYSSRVVSANRAHNLIVLGQPGTGKTHGVARAVELRLVNDYPALIITARRAPAESWKTILNHSLDGVSSWSTREIFAALEAMAARVDVRRARASDPSEPIKAEPTRVLVCIDGVDEAPDPSLWRERINELRTWLNECPNLRFVVTSRSYPPANLNPCGLEFDAVVNRRLDLPSHGDVPLSELAVKYLTHYQIDYASMPWLPEAFQDALALRLFALEYKGKNLASVPERITTSLSGLLKNKVEQIEQEFARLPELRLPSGLRLAHHGLLSVAKALQAQPEMDHDELCQLLVDGLKRVTLNQATQMLEVYANHGLILQWEEPATSKLAPPSRRVAFAFQQPLMDYMMACEATEQMIASGSKSLPLTLQGQRDWNPFYLTAVALVNDHGIMVGEDGYWTGDLGAASLENIKYAALADSSSEIVRRQIPQAVAQFKQGIRERNLVLQAFVLANSYRTDTEIVLPVVHETLCNFSSVFERDLFWSGPAAYGDASSEPNIGQILIEHSLHPYQQAAGLPLLFAWSLATVNNTYREYARHELAQWGSGSPGEFVKLLDLVFFEGDLQMQEDLATVMLGVMSLSTKSSEGGQQLATWILTNIFSQANITKSLNSVVRASARAAIERAVSIGDCPEADASAARPPYATDNALLPLKLWVDGEDIGSRAERFPIVHDLAWYVLDDSYSGFMELPSMNGDRKEARGYEVLAKYEQYYGSEIGPYDFAMSAALACIQSLGYNRTTGPGTTEASHGSLSKTSTFEEKYTWLAVHNLQGYLADRLPYADHGATYNRVPTYQLFLAINNPAASVSGLTEYPTEWYVPVEISPDLPVGTPEDLPARLKSWVNRDETPDFATWLSLPNLIPAGVTNEPESQKWIPLNLHLHLPEREGMGATFLEIGCAWMSQAHWDEMQISCAGNMRRVAASNSWQFDDVDGWQATPAGTTYASVKDVVHSPHLDEDESTFTIHGPKGKEWECYKTVTRVLEHSVEHSEHTYLVPSKIVRQHLEISDTNKQSFVNQDGKVLACYQEIRDGYDASQELLVADREAFNQACSNHQLKPFWLVSQFQNTTVEFTNKNKDGHAQNIRMWIVWEHDGQIQAQLFYNNWFKSQNEGFLKE